MFGLLRILSFWRIILALVLWFFVVKPWLHLMHARIAAYYWWMQPW
jgi:hypothetical protein